MQVQNIECQLAQVQLKRYLTGEELPGELLTDLETHLEECAECREAAKQQRVKATTSAPAEAAETRPKLTLQDILAEKPSRAKFDLSGLKNSKTLVLSGALALVLIAMSTVLRDPTKLFGAKADEKVAATTVATKDSDPVETPESSVKEPETSPDVLGAALSASDLVENGSTPSGTEDEVLDEPVPETQPVEAEPKTPSATAKPAGEAPPTTTANGLNIPGKPTTQGQDVVVVGGSGGTIKQPAKPVSKPAPRRVTKSVTGRKPAAKKPASSGIRVYDSSGKPIK